MDHRVSKDMISSGMTPSGKKTQADLGKTQYGSAPSPNRLMDAYHSMYENQKKETLDEGMVGDVVKKVKDVGKEVKFQVDNVTNKAGKNQKRAIATQIMKNANLNNSVDLLSAYQSMYADTFEEGKIPAGLQAYLDKKKGKKKDDDNGEEKKEGKKKAKKGKGGKPDFLDLDKDGDKKEPMKKASKEMKEGAGLYANIHAKRKRGGKMRKKGDKGAPSSQDFANAARTAKENLDLFDTVILEFVDQGYDEKDIISVMSNLSEEPITFATIGALLAKGGAAAGAAKGAAAAGAVKGAAGAAAAKGAGSAIAKGGISRTIQRAGIKMGGKTGGRIAKGFTDYAKSDVGKMDLMNRAGNTVASAAQGSGEKVNKTGLVTAQPQKKAVAASADLFDIVKGQLLDEGLSEEEIRDIMLSLTPEEIIKEIEESSLSAGSSDGHYHDGGDGVFRSKQQIGNMFNKNIPTKKQTGGKVDKMTRKSINTSARELGIQGPTTLKQSVEPEGETI